MKVRLQITFEVEDRVAALAATLEDYMERAGILADLADFQKSYNAGRDYGHISKITYDVSFQEHPFFETGTSGQLEVEEAKND